MVRRLLKAISTLLLLAGIAGLITGGTLLWASSPSDSIPPPPEETGDALPPLEQVEAPGVQGWDNCAACHWPIAGTSPGDVYTVTTIVPPPALVPQGAHKAAMPLSLRIPSIGIEGRVAPARTTFFEGGGEWEVPREDVAWYTATAFPGEKGTAVMSGHVSTRQGGGVFRNLYRIRRGAAIEVDTTLGPLIYYVERIKLIAPTDLSVLKNRGGSYLVLITCAGAFDPATREYSQRLVVTARLGASP